MKFNTGEWIWDPDHGEFCQVIETQKLWDKIICSVWLPNKGMVVRLPITRLKPLQDAGLMSTDEIIYRASAARVADALTQDILLAPLDASIIPLPHQIRALSRAISGERVRYLLADEVGLGKTIEAGLIMRELKLRGLVKRTLVVAPKGLVTQWVAEMDTHFNETFRLILSEDYASLKRVLATSDPEKREKLGKDSGQLSLGGDNNPFRAFDQIVVPMDTVKPPARGRHEALERFHDLITAGWDLIIVDEAHRLGGSTSQVARHQLGRALAEAAPYLLLLTATPHQGKTDHFWRLMSILEPQAFPDESSITKDRIQPYVIRIEKRHAIDTQGQPLFKPRRTELIPIPWTDRHQEQRWLYEAVTEYVREGYNQAIAEKKNYIGFLMILMQRLVASSTRAIRKALERRLEVLESPQEQLVLFPELNDEEWADMDGQALMEILFNMRLRALKDEQAEVKLLLETARRCESHGPDVKAEALLDWIYRLQAEEGDPELKILVFTEFVATQEMLYEFLTERGFKVACLNGSMSLEERRKAQELFAKDARILLSTDAGGEGLNLQFCHVVINYDIPWNPMRLEQRIGRVDRIGQTRPVRALNFVLEHSVEHRVLEVLEEKLTVIFEELGIDKTGDVLDSTQAEKIFDELYVEAILHPDQLRKKIEKTLENFRSLAQKSQRGASLLGKSCALDPQEVQQIMSHPLPYWVERMTVSYLRAYGGYAEKREGIWSLTWPNGEQMSHVVFSRKEAEENPFCHHLTLADPRVRELVTNLPHVVPGQPIPVITLSDLPAEVQGFWSLWKVTLVSTNKTLYRIFPLFVSNRNQVLPPTARHIWDQLITTSPVIIGYLDPNASAKAFRRLWGLAERQGETIYKELRQIYEKSISKELKKAEYAFRARRRAIQRIGLPQVREHRMKVLEREFQNYKEQLEKQTQVLPDLVPLVMLRVEGGHEKG